MKVMKLHVADYIAFFVMVAFFVGILMDRYYMGGGIMDGLIFGGLL